MIPPPVLMMIQTLLREGQFVLLTPDHQVLYGNAKQVQQTLHEFVILEDLSTEGIKQ